MVEMDSLNVESEEQTENPRPRRIIRPPKKETIKRILGVTGKVGGIALKGSLLALTVARVGTYLASSGIYAISKTGALEVLAASLLALGATVAIMPVATALGIGNKALGKNFNFSQNVAGGVRTAKLLTDPLVKGANALLTLGSGTISMATQKGLIQRISEVTRGQVSADTITDSLANLFRGNNQTSNPQNRSYPPIDDPVFA